ncbi:hypothetical protein EKO27_g8202 [Xylaria grammica]|uniref:Uncharacterized protein n=1 Tax=Xylaria grammica TaxID=363999 RepID=A0A439CXH2_9PEZI|nr:hypothetical protein EKO27_g8202 [Xylaria grammica]
MGKPQSHSNAFSDDVSLHSNVGESSTTAPYVDDDAPEIDIDDLPPNYSDAIESSEAAPMLGPGSAMNDVIRPSDLDAKVIIDQNTGAQAWVARSLEDPARLETYVRQLSGIPPRPYMSLVGTHTETTKDSKGKQEKNTVTDFDVAVELTPYLFSDAQYRRSWSQLRTVDNREKVHRGTIRAKRQRGPDQGIEVVPTCSLRQMVGFNEEAITHRLEGLVRGTNYRGNLTVRLVTKDARVDFYNDAKINRWRLTPWIRWFFFLTLTFILSWPYLLLRTKRWEVVVADWPFSRVNEAGDREYVSISEDQWYNMWARAICRAVLEKKQTVLDQSDLRRAQEADPAFDTGNSTVNGALGLFRAGIHAMNEVNRQLGWGGDC